MVLKKSKHLANTGNTLRRNISGRCSRLASFLSKASTIPKDESQLFPPLEGVKVEWVKDGNLKSSAGVWYSLNRDKRWHAPEEIEDQLLQSRNCKHDEKPVKVKAKAQKPSVPRAIKRARTVLVENPGDWLVGYGSNHQTYNWKILDSEGEFKKHKSCRSGSTNNHQHHNGDVVYKVMRPMPSRHWPYYVDGSGFNRAVNYSYYRFSYTGKGLRKHRNLDFQYEVDGYYDGLEYEESFDSIEDELAEEFCVFDSDRSCIDVDIASLIGVARQKKNRTSICPGKESADIWLLCQASCEHDSSDFVIVEKGEVLGLSDTVDDVPATVPRFNNTGMESDGSDHCLGEENVRQEDEVNISSCHADDQEVALAFRKSETRRDVLNDRYGHLYLEANTDHRSFAIFSPQAGRENILFSSALLFSAKRPELSRDADVEVFSVRGFGSVESSKLRCDSNSVVRLESFLDSLISPNWPNRALHTQKGDTLSIVETFSRARTSMHRLRDVFDRLLKTCKRRDWSAHELPSLDALDSHSAPNASCDLYELVCPVCLDAKSREVFTSLRACGHLVCNKCWAKYLSGKTLHGRLPSCPETKCEAKVGLVTMMLFMDSKSFAVFVRNTCERQILAAKNMKFCPTSGCTNFAIERLPTTPLLSSEAIVDSPVVFGCCGSKWCFRCQKRVHWPASCEAAAAYERCRDEEIGKLYDESGQLMPSDFKVKKCPFCRVLVEKWTGCDNVLCRCGKSFCWSCGKDLVSHVNGNSSCKETPATEFSLYSVDDLGGGRVKRILRTALKYRVEAREARALLRHLQVAKAMRRLEIVVPAPSSRLMVAKKSVALLEDCYALLECIVVAKAVCSSRGIRCRLDRFERGLSFRLAMLKSALAVGNFSNLKSDLVLSLSCSVQNYLRFLAGLGLVQNKL